MPGRDCRAAPSRPPGLVQHRVVDEQRDLAVRGFAQLVGVGRQSKPGDVAAKELVGLGPAGERRVLAPRVCHPGTLAALPWEDHGNGRCPPSGTVDRAFEGRACHPEVSCAVGHAALLTLTSVSTMLARMSPTVTLTRRPTHAAPADLAGSTADGLLVLVAPCNGRFQPLITAGTV